MKKLSGAKAIVTGGARGIGFSIAELLAENGADIAMCDVNEEAAKASAADIASRFGVKGLGLKADVSKAADCEAFVSAVHEQLGGLDILVNNAGITKDNLAIRMSEADWDAVLGVNLKGAFLMSKNAARLMMKQRRGRIINIASIVGQTGNAGQANYSASKSGLFGLTKTFAREFASRNILVNAVAPGFVQTKMTDALDEQTRAAMLAQIPLKRLAQPSDIARAVLFLAGEDSAYITGQILAVNGGLYM